MRRRNHVIAAAIITVFATTAVTVGNAAAAPADRRVTYVEIPNSAYVLQEGDVDLGVFPDDPVRFEVALTGRDPSGAARLAAAVSDPTSPLYGRFLSPSQYRWRFAPSDGAASAVTTWLRRAGMQITYNPSNHLLIASQGTVGAADTAFRTDLHRIQAGDGSVFTAPLTPLFVPSKVAGVVDGFVEGINHPSRLLSAQRRSGDISSDDHGHDSSHTTPVFTPVATAPPAPAFVNAQPCSAYWGEQTATNIPAVTSDYATPVPYTPCGYSSAQLQGAYGLDSLINRGIDGRGVTVAVTDAYASPTIVADINQHAASTGAAPWGRKFRQIQPTSVRFGYNDPSFGGDACAEQGWYGEETLDVEAVHASAPGANVLYVGASSCLDQDLLSAVNDVVDRRLADIVTNSWGGSNEIVDPVMLDVYTAVFQQAAIEGIGVFYSSGDDGDEVLNTGARSVDFPASDPWVTAVGGTSLAVGASRNYLFETGWGTAKATAVDGAWDQPLPGEYVYGGGGGTSQLFAQPAYQAGKVPASVSQHFGGAPGRAVPDLAVVGDPQTGFKVGQTQTFPDGSVRYGEYRIGGTSLSAPFMAGIEALADQAAGRPHGFANPAIYRLGANAFRDVVAPASTVSAVRLDFVNGVDDADGISTQLRTMNQTGTLAVGPGFDDVTGLGSPIGSAYVAGLATRLPRFWFARF